MMKKTTLCLALSTLLMSSAVMAKEHKKISQTIQLGDEKKIEISVPVGSIRYSAYEGNTVEIDIEIEPSNKGSFFFSSSVDLSDIELASNTDGKRLMLEIKEEDINQTWRIKVPRHLLADIDVGVGEVDVNDFAQTIDVNVGVGEVDIHVINMNYNNIALEAGVGHTDIEGFSRGVSNRSHLVGSNSEYRGDGEFKINVNVGVGDAEVNHK